MNWWFTNHAIVLDTAGRLMFQKVEPGKSGEWTEFLKLLAAHRPNCPINGLLLVIPADSLIRDTADKIEEKAGKIAQQFDLIQRTLGVRFPVFVAHHQVRPDQRLPRVLRRAQRSQHAAPDARLVQPRAARRAVRPRPGRPPSRAASAAGCCSTARRCCSTRSTPTIPPPAGPTRPTRSTRSPTALTSIAPRLRLYLEMIFVQGEWSPKPLFLRGIYFTSAMREGSALDRELADLLGVPVDQLPEGKVWERERPQFLKELFTKKVFREKGLVTRATNASGLQRRRQLALFGTGFAAIVALLVLTWLGSAPAQAEHRRSDELLGFAEQAATPIPRPSSTPGGGLTTSRTGPPRQRV